MRAKGGADMRKSLLVLSVAAALTGCGQSGDSAANQATAKSAAAPRSSPSSRSRPNTSRPGPGLAGQRKMASAGLLQSLGPRRTLAPVKEKQKLAAPQPEGAWTRPETYLGVLVRTRSFRRAN